MPIEVEIQGTGQIVEFPDGTPPEEIQRVMAQVSGAQSQAQEESFNPLETLSNAALEVMSGVNRGALSVADIPSDIVNAVSQIAGADFRAPTFRDSSLGRQAAGGGFIQDPTARQVLGTVGEFAAPGIPVGALAKARGPATSGVSALQARGDDVARELIETPSSPNVATKVLTQGGRAVESPVLREAQKQGVSDQVISTVKTATGNDRKAMREMLDVLKRGQKDPRFQAKNRPAAVAGRSLIKRVNHLKRVNKEAGQAINREADALKGVQADLSAPINQFSDKLDDFGVRIVDDGKGGVKADFAESSLAPGDRGPIKEVVRQMSRLGKRAEGQPDAFDAHQLKRIIDRNVSFGKTKTGLSGESERALKEFRAGLNESLQVASPEYKEANRIYSETLGALEALQDSAGRTVDFAGSFADEAAGTALRRLLSNAQSRANMMSAIDQAEEVGRRTGAQFDDDITAQMLFADELDNLFGTTARTSLKGQMQQVSDKATRDAQAAVMAAQGAPDTSAISSIIGRGVAKARGINEENAIKAIEAMLK